MSERRGAVKVARETWCDIERSRLNRVHNLSLLGRRKETGKCFANSLLCARWRLPCSFRYRHSPDTVMVVITAVITAVTTAVIMVEHHGGHHHGHWPRSSRSLVSRTLLGLWRRRMLGMDTRWLC